jgi:hypothetical protein
MFFLFFFLYLERTKIHYKTISEKKQIYFYIFIFISLTKSVFFFLYLFFAFRILTKFISFFFKKLFIHNTYIHIHTRIYVISYA